MSEASTTEHEQLTSDYLDLWHGDFSKLDVVAESVALYDPGIPEGELHGRDAIETFLRDLRTGFPDFEVTIDDSLVEGDTIMTEWTVSGTHDGEFQGIPPTGNEMEFSGMDKIVVSDGQVQEHRIYYNVLEMHSQLGLSAE